MLRFGFSDRLSYIICVLEMNSAISLVYEQLISLLMSDRDSRSGYLSIKCSKCLNFHIILNSTLSLFPSAENLYNLKI